MGEQQIATEAVMDIKLLPPSDNVEDLRGCSASFSCYEMATNNAAKDDGYYYRAPEGMTAPDYGVLLSGILLLFAVYARLVPKKKKRHALASY